MTPIEEAYAYEQLLELHSLTQEALAQRLGKGQSTIANKLRLLKLPDEIKSAIMRKELSERHARALMPLKEPELQIALHEEAIANQLNVKQLEERVYKVLNPEINSKKKAPRENRLAGMCELLLILLNNLLVLFPKVGLKWKQRKKIQRTITQLQLRYRRKSKILLLNHGESIFTAYYIVL